MKLNKAVLILAAVSLAGTFFVYPALPDIIPTHWNMSGQVDGTGSKNMVFLLGSLPFAVYALMMLLPKIDPRRENYKIHAGAYAVIIAATLLLLIALHWMAILSALGYAIDIGIFMRITLGILFIVMGNYLGQVRPNYFFGIRTPWTLASEQVWRKTHRVGGYAFALAGLLTAASVLFPGPVGFFILLGSLSAVIIFTFAYSYNEYRKLGAGK